jgi:hypothetical protein
MDAPEREGLFAATTFYALGLKKRELWNSKKIRNKG